MNAERPHFPEPSAERIEEIRTRLIEKLGQKALVAWPPSKTDYRFIMTIDGSLAASGKHFAGGDLETDIVPYYIRSKAAADEAHAEDPVRFKAALRAGFEYEQSLKKD